MHSMTGKGLERFVPDTVIPPGNPVNVELKAWALRPPEEHSR